MRCPRTNKKLTPVKIHGIEIDLSEGCGGVWFDRFELEKFDEAHEGAGRILVEHMRMHHQALTDPSKRLNCPIHTDVVMMRRYYSGKQQIEIDECPQCGGIWLDAEELAAIRELFPSREDYRRAQTEFVNQVMNSPEIREFEKESEQLIAKIKSVGNVLRSILKFGKE
ncbi:TFIIB-type zinc ribbon-containing protein [Kaarinaea lacus]